MTFRQYLLVMGLGTCVGWAAFWLILRLVDPSVVGWVGFVFFYVALGLSVSGTLALLGLVVRIHILRIPDVMSRQVALAFREAFLVAVLLVSSLFLLSRGLFHWLTALLLIGVVVLIETFFLSVRSRG